MCVCVCPTVRVRVVYVYAHVYVYVYVCVWGGGRGIAHLIQKIVTDIQCFESVEAREVSQVHNVIGRQRKLFFCPVRMRERVCGKFEYGKVYAYMRIQTHECAGIYVHASVCIKTRIVRYTDEYCAHGVTAHRCTRMHLCIFCVYPYL